MSLGYMYLFLHQNKIREQKIAEYKKYIVNHPEYFKLLPNDKFEIIK